MQGSRFVFQEEHQARRIKHYGVLEGDDQIASFGKIKAIVAGNNCKCETESLSGINPSFEMDSESLKKHLNSVYKQINAEWDVSFLAPRTYFFDAEIINDELELFKSKPNDNIELNSLYKNISSDKELSTFDKIIILFHKVNRYESTGGDEIKDVGGVTPQSGQFSFINSKPHGKNSTKEEQISIITHELGHTLGFPDFRPYVHKLADKNGNIMEAIVDISDLGMTGNDTDFTKANNKLADILGISKPSGGKFQGDIDGLNYTWHHHQDGKHMMLVPKGLNDGIRHAGGAAFAKKDLKGLLPSPFEITNKFLNCK
jgi:hypothetical protein